MKEENRAQTDIGFLEISCLFLSWGSFVREFSLFYKGMDQKLNRLKGHVDFLTGLLGKTPESIPHTYEALVKKKFRLMKELRVASLMKTEESVTNKSGFFYPDLPAISKISCGYSGQDFHFALDPANDFFYSGTGQIFFTNSGQTAVTTAMLFFYDVIPGVRFHVPRPLYHEAADILGLMKKISPEGKGPVVAYIDSMHFDVKAGSLDQHLKDAAWVLVDSTCWDMRSQEMNLVLESLRKKNIPSLIVRSHIKLDSLGAEYGLLGSLFFMGGNLSETEISHFTLNLQNKIAITRSSAGYDDLYPFWVSGQFGKMTEERTKAIRSNTGIMEKFLSENLQEIGGIRSFPHALYCILELPFKSDVKEQLFKSRTLSEIPYLMCDSFGFDQVNITFVDYRYDPEKCALRISGSDLSPDDLVANLAIIQKVLQKIYR
jgi:hypothetical protein